MKNTNEQFTDNEVKEYTDYVEFSIDNANYKTMATGNRDSDIAKHHHKVGRTKSTKRFGGGYTGLTNKTKGDDLIADQALWYVRHIQANNITELNFFSTGVKAGNFELEVLEFLTSEPTYNLKQSDKLGVVRISAIQRGYTINYVDVSEYKL